MRPDDPIVKHWCLNLVVNFPVPLSLLFPVLRVEALNVKEIPGFRPDDYAAAIEVLFNEQMIQFSGPHAEGAPDLANAIRALLKHTPAPPPKTPDTGTDKLRTDISRRSSLGESCRSGLE